MRGIYYTIDDMEKSFYAGKKVFISGGAGFIGHQLLDALIRQGSVTTVGDNLSSGNINNVLRVYRQNGINFRKTPWGYQADRKHRLIKVDFQNYDETLRTLDGQGIVIHLAAVVGGRGFIESHPALCCENLSINQNIIKAASQCGIDRILYTSSACVYPSKKTKLTEKMSDVDGWMNADLEYGWGKLMGETILNAFKKEFGLRAAIIRYVSVYGPWQNNSHVISSLIKRALAHEDPFVIWGSGKQVRDFIYIDDVVRGTLDACSRVADGDVFNLGSGIGITIKETAEMIFDLIGWKPNKILYNTTMPEGIKFRVMDVSKAKRRLGWTAETDLREGLKRTIAWHKEQHNI